jgi:microcin C transport system substrate-binding protein
MKPRNVLPAICRLPARIGSANRLSRREALVLGAAAAATAMTSPVPAQTEERHGISAFGDLKYPPDFRHFDYVNPDPPKGGIFSQIGPDRQ